MGRCNWSFRLTWPCFELGREAEVDRACWLGWHDEEGRAAASPRRTAARENLSRRSLQPPPTEPAKVDIYFATNNGFSKAQGRPKAKQKTALSWTSLGPWTSALALAGIMPILRPGCRDSEAEMPSSWRRGSGPWRADDSARSNRRPFWRTGWSRRGERVRRTLHAGAGNYCRGRA